MSRHVYSWYYNYVLSYMPFLCVAQPPTRSDLIGIMIGIMIINDYQFYQWYIWIIMDVPFLSLRFKKKNIPWSSQPGLRSALVVGPVARNPVTTMAETAWICSDI